MCVASVPTGQLQILKFIDRDGLMIRKFILLLILITFFPGRNQLVCYSQIIIKLGTATRNGNYYNLGKSIERISKEKSKFFRIEVIETQGSVDNIYRINTDEIDIALVQNDIAFSAENGLYPFEKKTTNLTGIMTFYFEPIYLITNIPEVYNHNQLINRRVNVGPLKSGLFANAKTILNSLGIWDLVIKSNNTPSEVIDLLLKNEIQAAFVNNISERLEWKIINDSLFVIPFSSSLIESLTKTYPYFTVYTSKTMVHDISTVAVKSLMVSKRDFPEELVHEFTKLLYENFTDFEFPDRNVVAQKSDIVLNMPLKNWHDGSRQYLNDLGILHSQSYLKYFWLLFLIPMFFIALILFLNAVFFSLIKKNIGFLSINSAIFKMIRYVHVKITRHKYIIILIFLFTAYLTNIVIVQYAEHQWAIQNNIVSNFDNQPFFNNLLWMFVFGGSGYEDHLFPISPVGKFFATLIPLIGLGGICAIVGFLTSDHIKNKIMAARGVKTKMLKDHIILCGWNENVPFLVKNLLHENIVHKKPIVILAEINDELPLEKYGIDNKLVSYVRGDATNRLDLDRANFKDADTAIIVADTHSSDPDAKSILKILTIEKYCQELEKNGARKNRENIYTIAEILDTNKFEAAYDALVNEIVLLGHIRSKVFVQSILNPGVSRFINEILTYNDFNDIYSCKIAEDSNLVNFTFDELLVKLRAYKILLMSINIENHREKEEFEQIMKKNNLTRSIITNPIHEAELKYRTNPGDLLIVLAQYEKTVLNALKKIKKEKQSPSEKISPAD